MAASVTSERVRRALVQNVEVSRRASVRGWRGFFRDPLVGRPASHPGVELAWIRSGEATYTVDGGAPFVARAGHLVVVPAATEHTTTFTGDLVAGAIEVDADVAREIADAFGGAGPALGRGIVADAGDVRSILAALDEEVHEDGAGRARAVEALVEALFVRVLRRSLSRSPAAARDPRLRAALEYMRAHLHEPIGVDELATAAAMSRFHFSRVFRDETGRSPYVFLTEARLDRAAARLRAEGCPVTTAAFDAGFRDLGRFAKAFRARFGVAPRAYVTSAPRSSPPAR